jgi:hypothetical protein
LFQRNKVVNDGLAVIDPLADHGSIVVSIDLARCCHLARHDGVVNGRDGLTV